jgi:hypothetical protein
MGLFANIRNLLFGAPEPSSRDVTSGAREAVRPFTDEQVGVEAKCGKRRLSPLRYRSTLRKTRITGGVTYAYAHRDPRTGEWLDFSSDSDARWLDYYGLPHLKTPQDVADWLEMPLGRLVWLTHRLKEGMRPQSEKESHYHYRWVKKRSGGERLLESPKPMLKEAQERVLRGLLDRVPPHVNAHGFVAGRSILSNARPHVGQRILLRIDLENFYPSVRFPRVVAIYRSLGFSREVGIWLARLTTSVMPRSLDRGTAYSAYTPYLSRHLPQGAPTSPALANLSAWSLDVRLTGLARAFDVNYTRYADDLTFSGSHRFGGALRDFIPLVGEIINSERFRANRRKRKIVRDSQRQTVTGVVVNAKPNISRSEFDRLKAILFNCVKHGPSTQNHDGHENFAAHLRGRIAHVRHLNRARGEKLLALFGRIDWAR